MKKRLFFVFLSALALASCGTNNQITNPTTEVNDTTTSKDLETTTENEETEGQYNLSTRVGKLISNIDKLPSTEEVFNSSEKTILQSQDNIEDYTNPPQNYYEYSAYEAFYSFLWTNAERIKKMGIAAKDTALEVVKQYDTWIDNADEYKYMVSYDAVLDEVHIKRLYGNRNLTEVTSGYTPDGKVSIQINWYDNTLEPPIHEDMWDVHSISYIEDQKWVYTTKQYRDWSFSRLEKVYVVESDLVNNKITQLYSREEYIYDEDRADSELTVSVQDSKNDLILVAGDGIRIFNKEGRDIFRLRTDYFTKVTFDLYQYNGLEYTGKEINPEDYNASKIIAIINGVDYGQGVYLKENLRAYVMYDSYGYGGGPYMNFIIYDDMDPWEAFEYGLEATGITFKDYVNKNDLYDLYTKASNIVETREALGFKGFSNITKDDVFEAYERYNTSTYTREEFYEFIDEPAIAKAEQVADESIYVYVNSTISGNVEFNNEALLINFKDVTATTKKSSLLSSNKTYQARVLLKDKAGYTVLASSNEIQYDNKDMVFTFEDEVIDLLDKLSQDNSYSIVLCVGEVKDEEFVSISPNLPVLLPITNNKVLVDHKEDENRTINIYLILEEVNDTAYFSFYFEIEEKSEEIVEEPTVDPVEEITE